MVKGRSLLGSPKYRYLFLKYLSTINRTELGLDSNTSSPTEQTASSAQSLGYTRICYPLRNPDVSLLQFATRYGILMSHYCNLLPVTES